MRNQLTRRLGVLAALLVLSTACEDLLVDNLNQPNRERALASTDALITLGASGFNSYFSAMHQTNSRINHFVNYGTEMTTTLNTWSLMLEMAEPRGPLDNDPAISVIGPQGPRNLWRQLLETASVSYDVLRTMDQEGITVVEEGQDITPQVRAYLKLLQGLSWGSLAVVYDQAPVLKEDIELESNINQQMQDLLIPYDEVLAAALEALDEAKAIAQQNNFAYPTFPDEVLWFGTSDPITNEDMAQLASTAAARFIVLSARTPQERAQLDWNRVLSYTADGLTRDIEPALQSGFRTSTLYNRIQNQSLYRWDNRLIGRSDISGAYQAWIAAPNAEKNRFDIVTPDRRITGPAPDSHGAYTRYRSDNVGFNPAEGTQYFSAYQWRRHANRQGISPTSSTHGHTSGTAPMFTVDENNLLRAEAMIYTGNLEGAAELINLTRTRQHTLPDGETHDGLPAVTVDGAPHSAPGADDCTPRTDQGACVDLMGALMWERMIELAGQDMTRGYADSRGFGLMVDGSYLHFPVPGNEADVIGMDWYTFGGVGTEWGAVYAPVTMSNVP